MPRLQIPIGMREKWRYIAFRLEIERENLRVDRRSIEQAIWDISLLFLGSIECSRLGLWLVEWDETNRIGILRCDAKYKYTVIGVLSLISALRGERVNLIPLLTSGTIKTLKRKLRSDGHDVSGSNGL